MQLNLPPAEVKPLHRESERRSEVVKELHHVPMVQAKAGMGAAVKQAIGDEPMKAYGHEGMVSAVCSGEKVPDYLARIYADERARTRFALALLEDIAGVEIETTVRVKRTA